MRIDPGWMRRPGHFDPDHRRRRADRRASRIAIPVSPQQGDCNEQMCRIGLPRLGNGWARGKRRPARARNGRDHGNSHRYAGATTSASRCPAVGDRPRRPVDRRHFDAAVRAGAGGDPAEFAPAMGKPAISAGQRHYPLHLSAVALRHHDHLRIVAAKRVAPPDQRPPSAILASPERSRILTRSRSTRRISRVARN